MQNIKNEINNTYGRLTVLSIDETKRGKSHIFWVCKCTCGSITSVNGSRLRNKSTSSCGCLRIEKLREAVQTHGKYKKRLYNIYNGIKNRCYNKNNPKYNLYGGNGITMCST